MRNFIIIALLIIFPAEVCLADMVYMKDGTKIDCKILSQTEDQLGVQEGSNSYFIKKIDIERIDFVEKKEPEAGIDWGMVAFTATGTALCVLLYVLARAGNNY